MFYIVMRRNSPKNPLRKKLIEDIIVLDRCVKDRSRIPRVLLKMAKEISKLLKNLEININQNHSGLLN